MIKLQNTTFCLIVALLFATVMNLPVWEKLCELALSPTETVRTGFLLSVPFFFVAFFNLVLIILSWRRIQKPVVIFLVILSAALSYGSFEYDIIFNGDMMVNIRDTNLGEAGSYMNFSLFLWMLAFGFLPAILIYMVKIKETTFRQGALRRAISAALSLGVIAIVALCFYADYSATIRNHKILRKIVVPSYAIQSAYKFIRKEYFYTPLPYKTVGTDAKLIEKFKPRGGEELLIVIIGETQRAQNYSLGGYARDTNTYTKEFNPIYFKNVVSCGTSTAVSVPCMFSLLPRDEYSKELANSQDNIVNILKYADVDVRWLENDGGCKDACRNAIFTDMRVKYKDTGTCDTEGCHDEVFIKELRDILPTLPQKDQIVVMHIMGSHGPTYWKRYPPELARFQPDCQRSDIQNCSTESLVNTYDNTILYSDYVMAEIIKELEKNKDLFKSAVLFISDHGESLGEGGAYLHGFPYTIAPEEQTHVPMMLWMSKGFQKQRGINADCIARKAEAGNFSHANFPHFILGLMETKASAYKADLDISYGCR